MIFGSTKTNLDYIVEKGLKRMDEAVERVIYDHCGGDIPSCSYLDLDREQAQRLYNYQMTLMAERAALSPTPWPTGDALL